MGKLKKKNRNRKHLADRVAVRKKEKDVTANPFEVHFNRQKHNVIGRRAKHDHGLPGVARTKALKKRKETLLQEYKKQFKSNKFIDRRIGENDPSMAPEEKMVARYAAERKTRKVDIFNLNEEEELTHFGQSLSEIEKFEDPRSDDEEDDDALAGDFMKESHFGGFLTKKENSSQDDKPKSRKEWIEELISTSKQKKHERQSDKEETHELTEKLDTDWKDIRLLMAGSKKKTESQEAIPKADSYDILVRSLKFDGRAKASDRLKTPEELALEEKERLEEMEAERIRRMEGVFEETDGKSTKTSKHRSADDLEENFAIDDEETEEHPFELRYKDGKLVVPTKPETTSEQSDDDEVESDDDNTAASEDKDGSGSDNSSASDSYSDIQSDGSQDDGNSSDEEQEDNKILSHSDKDSDVRKKQEQLMKQAREELPYTFPAPEKYDDFSVLVSGHTSAEQAVIVERIMKCHHPSLAEGNKSKLETLFAVLLQHVNDLATQDPPDIVTIDKLVPFLYQLMAMSRQNAGQCTLEVVIEKHDDFRKSCKQKFTGVRGEFPAMDTLIFFKLVSILFCTSDFRHPVVTPTMLFMGQILSQCQTKTRKDVAIGLYICSLFYEFVSYSKRLVPEALTYLCGILSLAIGNDPTSRASPPLKVSPPFKVYGVPVLKLEESAAGTIEPQAFKIQEMTTDAELTDEFRVNATWMCCELLKEFATIYHPMPSFPELFKPIQDWWRKLELEHYPSAIKDSITALESMLADPHPLKALVREKRKPQSVKFYEPKFEETYTGQKHGKGKQTAEKQRLLHKYKQEMKGALREIRKDNHFLARQQLNERMERDNERKRKVKELYQSLSVQEGDYKKLLKEKKKRK